MRLLPLLLVLAVVPARAQTALEDSVFDRIESDLPIERLSPFQDSLTELGRDPHWVSMLFNETTDPAIERPSWYVIRPDSMVWVRTPDGASVVLDPLIAARLGEAATEYLTNGRGLPERASWGFQDGRVYVSAGQSLDVSLAIVLTLVFLAAIVAAIAALVRALRRSKRRERDLVESRRRLADAREDERLRIARDIHDGPVQDLHTVRLQLSAMGITPPVEPIDTDVLGVIDGLRAISEDLRPPALASMGLEAAVRSFVGRLERAHPEIRVDVTVEGEDTTLPSRTGLALFRVVQESVNNAARHAAPRSIWVRIAHDPDCLRVTVEDDGRGFDVPDDFGDLGRGGHYGLLGMTERAESMDGQLSVRPRPGGGTSVRVTVPISRDPVQTD